MAKKIALHTYLEQIDQLLNENRFHDAVRHCRHILEQYPRHVDTYRLLAKALLEQQDYGGAIDMFQRVLSADPNDFISHVGLAIIFKEEDLLSQAIWHMERAFESDPYNEAIQDELKELYKQRDGRKPRQVPLTQGALARLYLRGELYQLAATELRQLLRQDEERIDLAVLLAETLWRDEQRVDAVELCLKLLETLPNAIQLNAILAEIWLLTGRVEEAHTYLRHLQELTLIDKAHVNPETTVGRALSAENAPPLPDAIMVTHLDDQPLEEVSAEPEAGWMSDLPLGDAGTEAEGEEALYDWFSSVVGESEIVLPDDEATWVEPPEPEEQEEDWFVDHPVEVGTEIAADDAVVTDWLRDLDESGETEPAEAGVFTDLFGEPDTDAFADDTTTADDMPDWLSDVTATDFETEQVDPSLAVDWLAPSLTEAGDEVEADESEGGAVADFALFEGAADNDDLIDADEIAEYSMTGLFGGDEADAPDWLKSISQPEPPMDEPEEEAVADAALFEGLEAADSDDLVNPDWIAEYSMTGLFGGDEADAPDWLKGSSQPEEPTDEPEEEVVADAALFEEVEAADSDALVGLDQIVEYSLTGLFGGDEADAPDWLKSSHESAADEPTDAEDEDLPDWLRTASTKVEDLVGDEPIAEDDDLGLGQLSELWGASPTDEWAVPAGEADDEADETAGLSDWLSAVDAGVSAEAEDAESFPSPFMTDSVLPADEESLPDWLMSSEYDEEDAETEAGELDLSQLSQNPSLATRLLTGLPESDEAEGEGELETAEMGAGELDLSQLSAEPALASDELPEWLWDTTVGETSDADQGASPTMESEAEIEQAKQSADLAEASVAGFVGDMDDDMLPAWLLDNPSDIEEETPIVEQPPTKLPRTLMGVTLAEDEDAELSDLISDFGTPGETEHVMMGDNEKKKQDQPDTSEDDFGDLFEDMDETMDWLEQLTAQSDETPEELPSLVEMEPEMVDEEDGRSDEALPDWLQDLSTAASATETESELVESRPEEMPDWLQDLSTATSTTETESELVESQPEEMPDWLQNLSTATSATEIESDVVESRPEELPDWLNPPQAGHEIPSLNARDIHKAEETVGDILDWLQSPDADEDTTSAEPEATMLSEPADVDTGEDIAEEAAASWSGDTSNLTDASDVWLEELAAQALGTVEPLDVSPVDEAPAEAGGEPLLEMEPSADEFDFSTMLAELAADDEAEQTGEELVAADSFDSAPEDLDDAMAWLEDLAAPQEEPVDDLLSSPVVEDELEAEVAESFDSEDIPAVAMTQDMTDTESETPPDVLLADEIEVPEDPDEAMAWLEQLAAMQGDSPEELPSLAQIVDDEPETEMLTWLAEPEPQPEERPEPTLTPEGEVDLFATLLSDTPDVPEELDDAMAWLEQLAAVQDVSLDEGLIKPAETAEPVTSEMTAEAAVADEGEALPEAAMTAEPEPAPELPPAVPAAEPEPEGEVDLFAMMLSDTPDVPEELDDAMAWLEQLAAAQGAPLEELPSLAEKREPPVAAQPEPPITAEVEPPAEPLMPPQPEPEEPQPTRPPVPHLTPEGEVDLFATMLSDTPDVPAELDDAMSWLEDLMAGQDLSLADEAEPTAAPAVSEPPPVPEAALEAAPETAEDELEANLDWLEQLAWQDAAPLAHLPVAEVTVSGLLSDDDLQDALDWLEQKIAPEAEPEAPVAEVVDTRLPEADDTALFDLDSMPEDPEAALAWLGELSDEVEEAPEVQPEAPLEAAAAVSPEPVETVEEPDGDYLEMPDEPGAAMDWLEQLAAPQESEPPQPSPLDTLSKETMPDWLHTGFDDMPDFVSDLFADVAEEPVETEAVEMETSPAPTEPEKLETPLFVESEFNLEAELAEAWPEWLPSEPDEGEAPGLGETGWLHSLAEPDVAGWLAAEEEATALGDTLYEEPKFPETRLPFDAAQPVQESLPPTAITEASAAGSMFALNQEQLQAARQAMAVGKYEAATTAYQTLVESGQGLSILIADLETAANRNPHQPEIWRLLGDAYMRNGQLQKALDTYRGALDIL